MSVKPIKLQLVEFQITKRPYCTKCEVLKTPAELQANEWVPKFKTPYNLPRCGFCFSELTKSEKLIKMAIPGPALFIIEQLAEANLFGMNHVEPMQHYKKTGLLWGQIFLVSMVADEEMRKRLQDFQWKNYGDPMVEKGTTEFGPIIYTRVQWSVTEKECQLVPDYEPYTNQVSSVRAAHMAALLLSSGGDKQPELQLGVLSVGSDRIALGITYGPAGTTDDDDSGDPSIQCVQLEVEMHWQR